MGCTTVEHLKVGGELQCLFSHKGEVAVTLDFDIKISLEYSLPTLPLLRYGV